MNIKRYDKEFLRIRNLENNNEVNNMENVLKIQDYMYDVKEHNEECEWELISGIFSNKIKRKGLTEEQVNSLTKKILKEVRKK